MWISKYLIFVILSVSVYCESEENSAVDLSPQLFDSTLQQNNLFVMFFAPWCGHCKRLLPIWEQLAKMMNVKEDPTVIIAKVDCTQHKDLCAKYEVVDYPTLKLFKLGSEEPVKFNGAKDLPTITVFMQDQLGGKDGKYEESPQNHIPEPISKLTELTDETFSKHVSKGKHFVKFYAPWCGHCQRLAPTWEEVAKSFEYDTAVQISKIDCTQYRPICQDFEVKGYPTLLWIEDGKKIEKYSGPRTHEDFIAYIEKMLGASREKKDEEKKDEKPAMDSGSVIVQLTGNSFDHGIERGVTFVKFYAPWCGHCQKLSPVWEQLAEKINGKPGIKIAKVDCTLGDNKQLCVEQQVEGYPTLFIYKNGEKLSEYHGSRELTSLYEFAVRYLDRDEL